MATTTPFTAKYAVVSKSKTGGTGLLDLDLSYGTITMDGQNIQYVGSAIVDAVFLRPGVTVDFTGAGAGADKLYLSGAYADYAFTVETVGKVSKLVLTRTVNGLTEKATVAAGDKLVFADGVLTTDALIAYKKTGSTVAAPTLDVIETSSAPKLDAVDAKLAPAITMTGLNKAGVTFAQGVQGAAVKVVGTAGVDTVYVKAGTQVDASGAGAGVDSIYFTGTYADYTKTAVGKTLVFQRTINGVVEKVTLANTGDTAFFADGKVATADIAASLKKGAATKTAPNTLIAPADSDISAPTLWQNAVVDGDSQGKLLKLAFNEELDASNLPEVGNFAVIVDGQLSPVSHVAVVGNAVLLTLEKAVTMGAEVSVSYIDPTTANDVKAIQDVAGNDAMSVSNLRVDNYSTVPGADISAPTLWQNAVVDGDSQGKLLKLAFNEELDASNLPEVGNFAVIVDGQLSPVSHVAVVGNAVLLTLEKAVTMGAEVSVSYIDPTTANDVKAIQDVAGNDAMSVSNLRVDNYSTVPGADISAPTLWQNAVVDGDSQGKLLKLAFNEELDASNLPEVGNFAVIVDGQLSPVSHVAVVGNAVLLTLEKAVTMGAEVSVSYIDPTTANDVKAIQDVAGNDAMSVSNLRVDNYSTVPGADISAPTLWQNAVVDGDSQGKLLKLAFNEELDASNLPEVGNFAVIVDGQLSPVSHVAVVGNAVLLTLEKAVTMGAEVSVSYIDPTTANDVKAIQDVAGNDAMSVSNLRVDNYSTVPGADISAPTLWQNAVVDGDSQGKLLKLAFNEELDASNLPEVGNFAVIVDGQLSPVSHVAVVGNAVLLTLEKAVTMGAEVSVSYIDPTTANDVKAIQDVAGNDAMSVSNLRVDNYSTVPAPGAMPASLDLGIVNGIPVKLVAGSREKDGVLTYFFDSNGDGVANDKVTHDLLDSLFNTGSDTAGAMSITSGRYKASLMTAADLQTLFADMAGMSSPWPVNEFYWTGDLISAGMHATVSLYDGNAASAADTTALHAAFKVIPA